MNVPVFPAIHSPHISPQPTLPPTHTHYTFVFSYLLPEEVLSLGELTQLQLELIMPKSMPVWHGEVAAKVREDTVELVRQVTPRHLLIL